MPSSFSLPCPAPACPPRWLQIACAESQVSTRAESRVWPLAKLPPGPSSRKSMVRTFWGLSFETTVRLSAVGAADAHPGVAHLLIVYLRIVDHHIEAQPLHRQSAYGGEQRVRSHYAIMLRGHQSNARIDEFLLRIENVQRCTLADAGFFTHTVERDLCRIDLRRRGFDLGFGRVQLPPTLHHSRAGLSAIDI